MSVEAKTDKSSVAIIDGGVVAVEPTGQAPAQRRRRRWPLIAGLLGFLVLVLAVAAFAANASLSQRYSPQRAVSDYLKAQEGRDVNAMWSGASYLRGDGSLDRLFNREALRAMMQLPANSKLSGIKINSTREIASDSSLVGVSLTWNGAARERTFTVRKDPSVSHWLFYPSWKVEIASSTINITLPNQPGTVLVDGIYTPPGMTATSVKVISGFHTVSMLETPLLDQATQEVESISDSSVSLPGVISKSATEKAAEAVKYAFAHCTGGGCPDHVYTAPDQRFIYYMTLPGYGNIDYTKYVITLTGDPTASMKLTIQADKDKVSVSGPCTSTYTVNDSNKYALKGDFSGTLTWTGGGFGADLGWNCWTAKG